MSKMGNLYIELSEQARDLGYETLEHALDNGYEVDYENSKLYLPGPDESQELAHQEWIARRGAILADLYALYGHFMSYDETQYATIIKETIKFIEEGEA